MSKYEEKLKEIQSLLKQKDLIEAKLKALLEPEKVAILPLGFSMNLQVLQIIQEAGTEGISAQEILRKMQIKYPNGIDRKKVASALAYLKNGKKSISQSSRGVYQIGAQPVV